MGRSGCDGAAGAAQGGAGGQRATGPETPGARVIFQSVRVARPSSRCRRSYATNRKIFVTTAVVLGLAAWLSAWPSSAASPNYSPPPGALNPQVTQSNIAGTICRRGWTRTVRPPLSYTANLKREQMRQRRLPGSAADYEEDHFIPLELGGHPTDPRNLWPQPIAQAKRKDQWELSLNRTVCAGRMTLGAAQHKIADPSLWR
jgi:hypothetical protein